MASVSAVCGVSANSFLQEGTRTRRGGLQGVAEARDAHFIQKLAKVLGIEDDQVRQAFRTAAQANQGLPVGRKDMVNQVAQELGLAPEDLQDALRKAADGRPRHPEAPPPGASADGFGRELAQALDVAPDQLKQAFDAVLQAAQGRDLGPGEFVRQAAQKLGVKADAFQRALQNLGSPTGNALDVSA